ncbi:putative KAP-like P-loop ATPase [Lipingzhangella halophila]|uniref:Putative KAP-like P-loop ATPase n=1 Tax=Lipingzhangella halophila TaxID=1783352 RepID=A0A7W7W1U4_9ACTN|nr:P-loop NTPase fold protein [Lipingzhangella halophila]MBB4930673.1 putative KAP-like P-loop ATPase [Lipingzhangella halophila]
MTTPRFFDDGPAGDSTGTPDLLGRRRYAEHALQLLDRVRDQSESGVLAMIGPWGAGKSTVLNMIMQALRDSAIDGNTTSWSVAELNPWMYSEVESLAAALFGELRAALPTDDRWGELRQKIGEFGIAISPVGKLGALAGMDASALSAWLFERVRGDVSASATKARAADALRDAGLPVLVVMDDVDRLTPRELLIVFKLIRLVGNLPNVYYLVSFDEQTLIDVLCRSDLVGDDPQRAREFLEKIIQVRLDLPAFRERDAAAMINQSLELLQRSHQVEMSDDEKNRFSLAYFRHLQSRLTTPRAIKRFFAQADATLGPLAGEVDLCDFLLVTFLRTSEPGVYRLMAQFRGALTGSDMDLERAWDAPGGIGAAVETTLAESGCRRGAPHRCSSSTPKFVPRRVSHRRFLGGGPPAGCG